VVITLQRSFSNILANASSEMANLQPTRVSITMRVFSMPPTTATTSEFVDLKPWPLNPLKAKSEGLTVENPLSLLENDSIGLHEQTPGHPHHGLR